MTEQRTPELRLDPVMILCARHMEPYRAQWPTGMASIVLLGISFLQGRPPTPHADALQASFDAGGIDPATTAFWEEVGEPDDLSARIAELLTPRPVCERASRDRLAAMYADSTIARDGECRLCGESKPGAPYSATSGPRRLVTKWPHVCFDCVLDRFQERP